MKLEFKINDSVLAYYDKITSEIICFTDVITDDTIHELFSKWKEELTESGIYVIRTVYISR